MGDEVPSTQGGKVLSVKERAALLNSKKAPAAASAVPDGGGHVLRSPGLLKRDASATSPDKKPEATQPPIAAVDASGDTQHQSSKLSTSTSPEAALPRPPLQPHPAEPLIGPNTYTIRTPNPHCPPEVSSSCCASPPEVPPPITSPTITTSTSDPEPSSPSPLVIASPSVCLPRPSSSSSLDNSGGVGPRRRSAGLEQRLAALAGAGGEVPLPFSPAMAMLRNSMGSHGGALPLPIMGLRSPAPPQMRRLSGSGYGNDNKDATQGAPPSLSHSTLSRPAVSRPRRPRTGQPVSLPSTPDNI